MGLPLPEKLQNIPELDEDLAFFYNAFVELNSERTYSPAPSAIPWTSIVKWAEYHKLDEETSDDLIYLVSEMDHYHLKRVDSKQKAAFAAKDKK